MITYVKELHVWKDSYFEDHGVKVFTFLTVTKTHRI